MTTCTEHELTATRRYWLEHLRCCEREGRGTKAYAESQGLEPCHLYAWRGRLRRLGMWSRQGKQSAFVPVVLGPPSMAAAATHCRLRFPNGLILEWEQSDVSSLAPLVARLAGLP